MNEREITLEALADLPESAYTLYDIRDAVSYVYGTVPGAASLPDPEKAAEEGALPRDKKLVLFCMHGTRSGELAEALGDMGFDAVSLAGGYAAWLKKQLVTPDRCAERCAEIEDSLRNKRKFRERLFTPFAKAIVRYELVKPGDKIAVCVSGGKDSMLMAKLFQELKRHRKFDFDLVFLVMDPGYNELNRLLIESNAAAMGIPVQIFETSIFDAVYKVDHSPCYLCARMRRGHLYSKARELGCNKIALGHHFDDVIETALMGMLWGGQMQGMIPKLRSTNYPGMELIRPMYLVREDDIRAWRDCNDLHFIQCACRFTDTCSSCREDGSSPSKRMETKRLIRRLKETNPNVEINIFNSTQNVCLDTLIAYKHRGVSHSFLDGYGDSDPRLAPGNAPEIRADEAYIRSQKASPNEAGLEQLRNTFMAILRDIRKGVEQQEPTSPELTRQIWQEMTALIAGSVDKTGALNDEETKVLQKVIGYLLKAET